MANHELRVIVAGAGLGGLTLALCLARAGFAVQVLEQASALGEVGAGVQISANGARVLHLLGLAPALDAVAFRPERGEMRHWHSGETLLTRPLGETSVERFGYPYYHLHRADLHRILTDALTHIAPQAVRLRARLVDLEHQADRVSVVLEDGERLEADIVVGCDGIHSRVRERLFGADAPRFTGCVAWRATVPTASLPAGHVRPVASNWLGRGGHFVHYYLRRGALVNCVGVIERDEWLAESWSSPGTREGFLTDFQGWHEDLQVLIRAVVQCFRWGLFDRDPMPRWSQGRVTLLGDACHPMLPFMAQGAVMAIEDAYTLCRCLQANDEPEAALARYESLRRERTARVQQMSRDNIEFFHNPDVDDLVERLTGHRDAHLWLYGHDVSAVQFSAT
ncbi:MAG: FAD-dependent monooxygenase [Gammaproteobacteria bacterium]|nr:FAD-dependent monooxygenase [Gammaproteobacteria bacterium]